MSFTQKAQELMEHLEISLKIHKSLYGNEKLINGSKGLSTEGKKIQMREDLVAFKGKLGDLDPLCCDEYDFEMESACFRCRTHRDLTNDITNAIKVLDGGEKLK
jgi:hypothetical protein